jgi:branched-chain amino acid transport system substrate-binding protein
MLMCFSLVSVLVLSIPLLGSAVEAKEKKTIKVGLATFVTGALAEDGRHHVRGMEIMRDYLNDKGGVLGRPLELVVVDIGSNSPSELAATRDALKAADVDVVMTSWWLNPIGTQYMLEVGVFVVQVGWVSADWDAWWAVRDRYPYFVQLNQNEAGYGVPYFKALTDPELVTWKYPNKKAAIMKPDFEYSIRQARSWREEAERAGWEIVLDETHPINNVEFGPQMTKIRDENPAIVFMCSNFAQEMIAAYADFIENPTNSIFVITWGLEKPEFRATVGAKANGVIGTIPGYFAPGYAGKNPQYMEHARISKWIREECDKRYGELPASLESHTYDQMMIWSQAVERAGDVRDFDGILEAMLAYPVTGAAGRFVIDPETHASSYGADKIPLIYNQMQNGEVVLLAIGESPNLEHLAGFQVPWWIEK